MSIRSVAKALIVHEEKILLNQCKGEKNGIYYSLPGGGQNQYETLEEAIIRECREETGYEVIPVRFAALFEEIYGDEELRINWPDYSHRIYHIFLCKLASEERANPTEMDLSQTASEWVELPSLAEKKILPEALILVRS
jgi:8-oxo-dGTP diphosphatase